MSTTTFLLATSMILSVGINNPATAPSSSTPLTEVNEPVVNWTEKLIESAKMSDPEGVRTSLDRGARPGFSDELGFTPLMFAVRNNDIESVELLLLNGADPNQRNHVGATAIFMAAKYGYKDVALKLIEHGANVNARNELGHSPLAIAREHQRGSVARAIRRAGGRI